MRKNMQNELSAFILAAGEGTRMRPLTANIPKPLLPVAGKPFLEHMVESLGSIGVKNITILVGWQEDKIKEYFGNGKKYGVNVEYIEQRERLGTAHAVGYGEKKFSEDFLCINGDIVIDGVEIENLIKFYKKYRKTTMSVVKVSNPQEYGVVELSKDAKKVVKISEKPTKPAGEVVNAGIYIFTPEIFDYIKQTEKSSRGEYEITDSLQMVAENEKLYAYLITKEWLDIKHPWDLLTANEILLKKIDRKIEGKVEPFGTVVENVRIGAGTIIKNGSYIVGPVLIGKNCEIGPNCLIRPYTYVGDFCKIGNGVEIKNSIIMSHTHVPHHNYIGDSIVGERCNFGAGTKIANLRLDEKTISSIVKGKKISTGRRKLGAIIGDDVKIGINSSIDVGTIIGEHTYIGLGAVVSGWIAPNSRIH